MDVIVSVILMIDKKGNDRLRRKYMVFILFLYRSFLILQYGDIEIRKLEYWLYRT